MADVFSANTDQGIDKVAQRLLDVICSRVGDVEGVERARDASTLDDQGSMNASRTRHGRDRESQIPRTLPSVLEGHTASVRRVVFGPDGALLASAGGDGTVRVWEVATGKQVRAISGDYGWIYCVSYSPDGKLLSWNDPNGTIRISEAATGKQRCVLTGYSAKVVGVTFSPNGARLASIHRDGTVRVWDIATGKRELVLQAQSGWARILMSNVVGLTKTAPSVVFSPDGAQGACKVLFLLTGQG